MSRDQRPGRIGIVDNNGSKPRRRSTDPRPTARGMTGDEPPAAAASKVAARSAIAALPMIGADAARPRVLLLSIAFLLACVGGGVLATFLNLAGRIGI